MSIRRSSERIAEFGHAYCLDGADFKKAGIAVEMHQPRAVTA